MDLFGLEKFDKILSRLAKIQIDIYPKQCSRNRNRNSSCQKCVEVCPTRVLSADFASQIDLLGCTACGLCASVCPNGVFELKNPTDQQLLSQIGLCLKENSELIFICDKIQPTSEENSGQSLYLNQAIKVSCLGRLNEAILVGSAALGASIIWLNNSQCENCEVRSGAAVIEEMVRASQQILEIFNSPAKIIKSPEPPDRIKNLLTKKQPTIEEISQYSRRDFLTKFRKSALATGTFLIESSLPIDFGKTKSEEPALKYRLPTKRILLIKAIRELAALSQKKNEPFKKVVPAKDLPFYQIEINNKCSVCGLCALFCPTKALVKTDDEEQGSIGFNLAYCTRCDLCKLMCLDNAIAYRDTLNPEWLLKDEKEALIVYEIYQCKQCKLKFGSLTKTELCRFCKKRQDLISI